MVLLSGGIDSATCLYLANKEGYKVRALTVRIHGTAQAELRAAKRIARSGGVVEHRIVSIPELREAKDIKGQNRLAAAKVPPTYIPMKNAIFYSLASAYDEEVGAGIIIGGHNADDRTVFADTSEEFFVSQEKALRAASPRLRELRILRPLRELSKAQVVKRAAELQVPLGLTWSCHRSGAKHCWKCPGCEQRTRAFEAAGVKDPLMPKRLMNGPESP